MESSWQGDWLHAERCFVFSGKSSFFPCLVSEEVIVCDASLTVDESLARIVVVLLLVVFAACSLHGCSLEGLQHTKAVLCQTLQCCFSAGF